MNRQKRIRKTLSLSERRKRELRLVINMFDCGFEEAVNPRIININHEIGKCEERINEIEQQMDDSNEEFDEDGERSETFIEFYEELGSLGYEIDILSEQRFSIEEMKLVGL